MIRRLRHTRLRLTLPRIALFMLALLLLAGAAGAQTARRPKKPKRTPVYAAKTLPPAVVDSFRTIILTTCPEDEEESWAHAMREEMAQWLNVRYRRAGLSMKGVDCSGFIKTIFRGAFSLDLPHSAASQSLLGDPVEKEELRFGDLLFFRAKKRINHVGIYIGDGYFVHSSRTNGVRVDPLFGSRYYAKRYARARRIVGLAAASD